MGSDGQNAPGSYHLGRMPSHGAMVYQRHRAPIHTMSNVQITHDPDGPGALRDVRTMSHRNSVSRRGTRLGVRGKLLAGDNFNEVQLGQDQVKVKIGRKRGGAATGTVSASHATNTLVYLRVLLRRRERLRATPTAVAHPRWT